MQHYNTVSDSVFISELLGGDIPPKFSGFPKMLRHVINYTLNANFHTKNLFPQY